MFSLRNDAEEFILNLYKKVLETPVPKNEKDILEDESQKTILYTKFQELVHSSLLER